MSGANAIRETFLAECEELLEALLEGLGALDRPDCDADCINAVFRAVHSIKGGAGAFGLDDLVTCAHRFETLLDLIRNGHQAIEATLLKALYKAADSLSDLIDAARADVTPDPATLQTALQALNPWVPDEDKDTESFEFEPIGFDLTPIDLSLPEDPLRYRIEFAPTQRLYANGHDPHLLLEALSELGEMSATVDLSKVPPLTSLEDGGSYLAWTIDLITSEPEPSIREIFEFVEDLCDPPLRIEGPPSSQDECLNQKTEEVTTADAPVLMPAEERAPSSPTPIQTPTPRPAKQTLRVDLTRVDRLINMVGELIINQAMISQRLEALDLPSTAQLNNEIEDYKMLARDIQEGVMSLRAQPVKSLFQRMARIVRETSEESGKSAQLKTVGDSTEVDKTVIERLADPLTHMLRNAVDHGLEPPEARRAAGKDETGTVFLSAAHRSGNVVIDIRDDGGGLDRERIRQTALAKNLVSADADLTESEIDNLLFLPGFSTASTVSSLSGRGVGMDVVRTAVGALGGRISITSEPGEGTAFSIVLPLTLAVMDGFVIKVAGETMVVPISAIFETLHPRAEEVHKIGTQDLMVLIRGQYIPIIDVAARLGLRSSGFDPLETVLLVVNDETAGLCALAVDDIQDQRQVVVKSLAAGLVPASGVSSATILGDGKIALILDPDNLAKRDHSAVERSACVPQQQESHHVDR